MGQKCESSLNIRDKNNILTQFSNLKVVLASFCWHLKELFIFLWFVGKRSMNNVKKMLEKSGNF